MASQPKVAATDRRAAFVSDRHKTLTIWSTPAQVEAIDRMASERGMSRAQFLRKVLNEGLKSELAA